MNVTLGVLADYANVTREGKLNIMGIFENVRVRTMPAMHPEMRLVLRLEAQYAERDRPHPVRIQLNEPDGPQLFEINAEVTPKGGMPGEVLGVNHIITLTGVGFKKLGTHQFSIFVDGDLKKQIPLRVSKIDDQQLQLPDGG